MSYAMRLLCVLLVPLAGLMASVATVPIDSHDDERGLTPTNFKQTIASGVWLVKFFSPYCGHCVHFAPTWRTLGEELQKSPDLGVHIAQVNCAVHGDFCVESRVQGWPSIFAYKNGEFVEQFKGNRELERLLAFATKQTQPAQSSQVDTLDSPTRVISSDEGIAIETQNTRADINPDGTVLSLNDNTFGSVIDPGPVFVKFFAPWCGHCKRLAPIWVELATRMQHRLTIAEVNCDESPKLCQAQDILGYPMLFIYVNGRKSEYMGARKLDKLEEFALKASAPAVQTLVLENLEKHVEESNVVYLLLHTTGLTDILNEVTKAAQPDTPPIYTSSSRTLFVRYAIPSSAKWALVALKDHDSAVASATLIPGLDVDNFPGLLRAWLLRHNIPTVTVLDRDSFQPVMHASHHPLVVIVATPPGMTDSVKGKLKEIGSNWKANQVISKSQDVVFTWMDSEKWSEWLKSMYGIQPTSNEGELGIIVAHHDQLLYWDHDPQGRKIRLTSSSILSSLEGIENGTLRAKCSASVFERFIRMLDRKKTAAVHYITTHPIRVVFFVSTFLLIIYAAVRHVFYDPAASNVHARLD